MTQTAKECDYGFRPQQLELAQGEPKVALVFADYSSAAYCKLWPWLGMAPDGSPLLVRDIGTQEIYALDWEAP